MPRQHPRIDRGLAVAAGGIAAVAVASAAIAFALHPASAQFLPSGPSQPARPGQPVVPAQQPAAPAQAAPAQAAPAQQSGPPEIWQGRRADFAANVLAVGGFDTVAFHTQRTAVAGNGQFRVSWKNAEWHFASAQNRDLFVADPDRYAPQYGGWCAFAVANGARAASDPRFFDLVNGRLYLNQSTGTQTRWRGDQAGMIQRGDQNWPRLLGR